MGNSLAQAEPKAAGNHHFGRPQTGRQFALSKNLEVCKFNAPLRADLDGISPTGAAIALQAFKHGELNYSRNKNNYVPTYHSPLSTYRRVVGAVDELEAAGYLINTKQKAGTHNRTRSVITATDLLHDVVCNTIQVFNPSTASDMRVETMREQILTPPPLRLLVMRDENKNPAPYNTKADHVKRKESKLRQHEELMKNTHITGCEIEAMTRVFNNGSWKQGGRAYGPHQNMPKSERALIQIAGEPTVELDYTAIHPSLLYAQQGLPIPADCYDVPMFDRDHIKLALVILINANTLQAAALTLAASIENIDRENDGFELLGKSDKPTALHLKHAHSLIKAVKARHKPIQDSFHSGVGVRLQNIDANIAEAVWWTMCQRGIVVLPVHDSFIVQKRHADMLKALMIEAAMMFGNAELNVK